MCSLIDEYAATEAVHAVGEICDFCQNNSSKKLKKIMDSQAVCYNLCLRCAHVDGILHKELFSQMTTIKAREEYLPILLAAKTSLFGIREYVENDAPAGFTGDEDVYNNDLEYGESMRRYGHTSAQYLAEYDTIKDCEYIFYYKDHRKFTDELIKIMQPLLTIYQKRVSDYYRAKYSIVSPMIKCAINCANFSYNCCSDDCGDNNMMSIISKVFEDCSGQHHFLCMSCALNYRKFFKAIPMSKIMSYYDKIESASEAFYIESQDYGYSNYRLFYDCYGIVNYSNYKYYRLYVADKKFRISLRSAWIGTCIILGLLSS